MQYPEKADIQIWIPQATEIFQSFMPAIDVPYPPVYIGRGENYMELRRRLVRETGCAHDEVTEESVMEYIHGDKGNAIIICQNYLPDDIDEHFFQMFWHELGHFYAINTEDPSFLHYSDPGVVDDSRIMELTAEGPVLGMSDERLKQEGYWFWQEFIAETLANYVSYKDRSTRRYYHPELLDWHPDNWSGMVERLLTLLEDTFWLHMHTLDEYSLAHYFALLLTNDFGKLYAQAAEDGKLMVYDEDKIVYPTEPIDATCIDELDESFQPSMRRMMEVLVAQLAKPECWKVTSETLLALGRCIGEMMLNKIRLMASER